MPEVPPAFAAALETQRDALNAAFALRQRAGAKIDPSAFLEHLQTRLSPIVAAVEASRPERIAGVVAALYDVSLDLFAASLLGPEARLALVGRVWDELLPAMSTLLARKPQEVAACLSNAAMQVASQPGTRPELWLTRLIEVAPRCDSIERLLEVGLVAAWQAGLVQFRTAALAAAARLPPELAATALGMPTSAVAQLSDILAQMTANPWANGTASGKLKLELVATVGAFIGFGGVFLRPPMVSHCEGRIVCSDGVASWQLLADACGSWFRPLGHAANYKTVSAPQQPQIDKQGTVRWGELSLRIPHLAAASSQACDGATLAVTIPTSHHVFLLGKLV